MMSVLKGAGWMETGSGSTGLAAQTLLWAGLPGGASWPLLILAGILAACFLVLMLRRPDTGTWLFALVLYSNVAAVATRFHGVPSFAAGATILLILFPVAYHVLLRGERIQFGPAPAAVLGFFAVQFVGVFVAPHRELALERLLANLAEGLVLYLLLINAVRTPAILRHAVWALLVAGAGMGALGLFQAATRTQHLDYGGFAQVPERLVAEEDEEWVEAPKPRAAGPIGEKNYYAQFMLMLAPLAFVQRQNERLPWMKLLALGALLLILAGVGLSGSRGAAVGFAAVLLVMAAFRYVTWTQLGILGIAGVLVVALTPSYRERLSSLQPLVDIAMGSATIQNADKAIQGRATEMVAALLIFFEHPLLGVGPGNFGPVFVTKADLLGFQVHSTERLAHCMYLEIAAENGALGLLCWVVLLALTLRALHRTRTQSTDPAIRNAATGFFLALVVLASTGVFLSFAYTRYYWFMLALAGAAAALGQQIPEKKGEMPVLSRKLEVA
ncbi:MAG: O-antigen ligase family protein [Pirellulales bacterium]